MSFAELNVSVVITDFADEAVVLPLAGATLGIFIFMQWWRGAMAWVAAVGFTLALILLLKLRFFACNQLVPDALVRNPSGHTAAAAAVYGGLAAIAVGSIWNISGGLVPLAIAIATPIAIVIGASRLQLDQHSMLEVVVGSGIGIAGAATFAFLAGAPKRDLRFRRLLLLGLVIVALLHGVRMPIEPHLQSVGKHIRLLLRAADIGIC
jgi:membrane-associated phospholipid phosphatase